jgi:hypothetical protein
MRTAFLDGLRNDVARLASGIGKKEKASNGSSVLACLSTVLATLLVFATLGAQNKAKVIELERLVLRDENGKVRAELAARENSVVQTFYSANGKRALALGVDPEDTVCLYMFDKNERVRVVLELDQTGPELAFNGRDGEKPRLHLGVFGNDLPALGLFDSNNKTRVALGIYSKDLASFTIKDENDRVRFQQNDQ